MPRATRSRIYQFKLVIWQPFGHSISEEITCKKYQRWDKFTHTPQKLLHKWVAQREVMSEVLFLWCHFMKDDAILNSRHDYMHFILWLNIIYFDGYVNLKRLQQCCSTFSNFALHSSNQNVCYIIFTSAFIPAPRSANVIRFCTLLIMQLLFWLIAFVLFSSAAVMP